MLTLCQSAADLPDRLPPFGAPIALELRNLRAARQQAREAGGAAGLSGDRAIDLLTAVTEAAVNALRAGRRFVRASDRETGSARGRT